MTLSIKSTKAQSWSDFPHTVTSLFSTRLPFDCSSFPSVPPSFKEQKLVRFAFYTDHFVFRSSTLLYVRGTYSSVLGVPILHTQSWVLPLRPRPIVSQFR